LTIEDDSERRPLGKERPRAIDLLPQVILTVDRLFDALEREGGGRLRRVKADLLDFHLALISLRVQALTDKEVLEFGQMEPSEAQSLTQAEVWDQDIVLLAQEMSILILVGGPLEILFTRFNNKGITTGRLDRDELGDELLVDFINSAEGEDVIVVVDDQVSVTGSTQLLGELGRAIDESLSKELVGPVEDRLLPRSRLRFL
jgi:hypothetical protein